MVCPMNGGAVMFQYKAWLTGVWVAKCSECGTVCASWDDDDLNDDGQLVCHCEGVDRGEA